MACALMRVETHPRVDIAALSILMALMGSHQAMAILVISYHRKSWSVA
jgi:hypothetical protein